MVMFVIASLADGLTQNSLHGSASESVNISLTVVGSGSGVSIDIIAIPEKRVPLTGNNSTLLTIEVRDPGETSPRFTETVVTGSGGTYSGMLLTGLSAGTYDITAKGYSHLRIKKSGVNITDGETIDFSNGGTVTLPSGDVNSTNGDNKVNGIDLTLIVSDLNGVIVRYDLNRDGRVNGIDLTNAVTNLNDLGDD